MSRMRTELPPHEADYWQPLSGGRVACGLCPHACRLGEGQRGLCRSRVNEPALFCKAKRSASSAARAACLRSRFFTPTKKAGTAPF